MKFKIERRFLGGKQGNGRQFISWINADDFCRSVHFILNHAEIVGHIKHKLTQIKRANELFGVGNVSHRFTRIYFERIWRAISPKISKIYADVF
jgi:NAD dependent epimerase/dehydratase family enzyme